MNCVGVKLCYRGAKHGFGPPKGHRVIYPYDVEKYRIGKFASQINGRIWICMSVNLVCPPSRETTLLGFPVPKLHGNWKGGKWVGSKKKGIPAWGSAHSIMLLHNYSARGCLFGLEIEIRNLLKIRKGKFLLELNTNDVLWAMWSSGPSPAPRWWLRPGNAFGPTSNDFRFPSIFIII